MTGEPTPSRFEIGERVEKFVGDARWTGLVVARYSTTSGLPRYVVEVEPQRFQMIVRPDQLRSLEPGLEDHIDAFNEREAKR